MAMPPKALSLKKVTYDHLKSRQKEIYNFQKVSAVLADYGYQTLRLTDDWQGADFIASHFNGNEFVKVQLKGRLTLDSKYQGKDIWIAFFDTVWYLYPHDEALRWARANMRTGKPANWDNGTGIYTYPSPPKKFREWLSQYALTSQTNGSPTGAR